MRTMTIGEFKSRFSSVLERVKAGEGVIIGYGKRKEKVAVLMPYRQFRGKGKKERKLGFLARRASYEIRGDFSLSDEELLSA